nr:MAG TPA: hypothetical protein [Bacteriophage sp.]
MFFNGNYSFFSTCTLRAIFTISSLNSSSIG